MFSWWGNAVWSQGHLSESQFYLRGAVFIRSKFVFFFFFSIFLMNQCPNYLCIKSVILFIFFFFFFHRKFPFKTMSPLLIVWLPGTGMRGMDMRGSQQQSKSSFESYCEKAYLLTCVPHDDSNQHEHPLSLIKAIIVSMRKLWILRYSKRTMWLVWAQLFKASLA